ncbi:sulfatase-like hydrolase/transferase [Marinovum sp. 2_MG-2023]|uniref:sulfatase-like hydrolase/transferase n=1 Tax=unclassified Marinovum TaxID=2647166 RepID=UPI0026E46DD7|nr:MULTISPECIES: sulfatase-like hydrolase/transferase [unclassified Marinovum]MDO6732284.1 sulfatase-like hydrolase/transferase [Marinovum sp. 2_MG-2023]MDO6781601.1 sulfatase-like hydrolase/transferase [Marinovum sp. 1_MG-2023]
MTRRPNFIFLIADDHRARSLGASGCDAVTTPNLDALAARGTFYRNAHCQGGFDRAVCMPSRATLMTGRDVFALRRAQEARKASSSETPPQFLEIPSDMPTFPELLRAEGYRTHGVGKWHNDRDSFGRSFSSGSAIFFGGMCDHDKVPVTPFDPQGIFPSDTTSDMPGFSTDLFSEAAKDFLRTQDGEEPFLLYTAFTAPHDPRTPPPAFMPNPDDIALPADYLPLHPFDNGEAALRDELLEDYPRSPEAVRRHLAEYYGMIAHLDAAIGDILATAEAQGLLENTVVVYTSDHGLGIGSHGLMGKQNLYEHSLGIPLILAGPGIEAGQQSDALVWHGDTRATVLDLAGITPPQDHGNLSLAAHAPTPQRDTFGAIYRMSQRMIRDARYKYVRYYPASANPAPDPIECTPGSATEQLFDLNTDPFEQVNLAFAPAQQDRRHAMAGALQQWQAAHGDALADS